MSSSESLKEELEQLLKREADARERLSALAEGSRRLMGIADPAALEDEVLALATKAVRADGHAVWRRNAGVWSVAACRGMDPSFAAVTLPAENTLRFTEPIIAEDVEALPMLESRREAYARSGVKSLLSVPLEIRGRPAGSIVFYYRERHRPDQMDVKVAEALGHLAAAAISSTELLIEQQALERAALRTAQRSAFLADISARLNTLDYESNLNTLANLAVPTLADWCVVDLAQGPDQLRRLVIAHVDPKMIGLAEHIQRDYPPRADQRAGIYQVFRTGEPELYESIDDAVLASTAQDERHLELLRKVGIRSAMLVPLKAGSTVFGVMTFVISGGDRNYDREDLVFAVDLARRASFAIENARLYQQAQESNQSKEDFLAALSHELRTPLNAIIGWTSILSMSPNADLQRGLEVIHRNAKAQTALVDELLDASRIESGKMTLELANTPVASALHAAIETVTPAAEEKSITITVAPAPLDVRVWGDAARLQQVFLNLLGNAVKFTNNDGRITVAVATGHDEAIIAIQDTGVGMREEVLPLVFDRFKQADAATTRRYRGLGLGLSLARQLVQMHGGRISAESDGPGKGSTFTVYLPLLDQSRIPVAASAPARWSTLLNGLRILAVDDDADALEVLTKLLRMHGAEVATASSAQRALQQVQRGKFSLLISDLAMPDEDGYALLSQLRRLEPERGGSLPAIALSAFVASETQRRSTHAGFAAHVTKPVVPDVLLAEIQRALGRPTDAVTT